MNISEKEIEDWAERAPYAITGCPGAQVVARQLTLPSGRRLDLLIQHQSGEMITLWVAELKAVTGTPDALMQLLEYVAEVAELWGIANHDGVMVRGVLVCPGFDGAVKKVVRGIPNVHLACVQSRIQFEYWEMEPEARNWPGRQMAELGTLMQAACERQERDDRRWSIVPIDQTPARVLLRALNSGVA